MLSSRLRQFFVLFFAISQFVISQILFTGNFNDSTVQPPVNLPDLLAQPAGYAFSIWFVIYLGCLGFAVYQVRPKYVANTYFSAIGPWAAAGFALSTLWVILAGFGPLWLTPAVIILMLACIGLAYERSLRPSTISSVMTRVTQLSLALYTGWLSAATWLNLGDTLAGYGFTLGLEEPLRSILVLAGALGTAVFFIFRSGGRWAYSGTIIWALVGILVKNGFNLVGWLALLGMVLVVYTTWQVRTEPVPA